MSFNQHLINIKEIIQSPSLQNLDLVTAYYLGLRALHPDEETVTAALEEKIKRLHQTKTSLKFLDRLIAISGSNSLTPETKLNAIETQTIIPVLESINHIVGKDNVTVALSSLASRINDSSFHEEFLAYESEAHHRVVGALLQLNPPTIPDRSAPTSTANTLKVLYSSANVGRTFLSLDLRQANWTALRDWNPNLPTWEEFVLSHLPTGPLQHLFSTSKNFRQVTFGAAMKKKKALKFIESRQVSITRKGAQPLIKKLGNPFCCSNDEVIFRWDDQRDQGLFDQWATKEINPIFRLTRLTIVDHCVSDGCFTVKYHDLLPSRDYTLLRCSTPEVVEARLNRLT